MTRTIIRRYGSAILLTIATFILMSSSPATSSAHRHAAARGRKSSHNASHHRGAKRYARLSRHHRVKQHLLTSIEKKEMIQKIQSLASSTVVSEDSVAQHTARPIDIQQDLAQEAKEELAEDSVDVSIAQFFRERPGAVGSTPLDQETAKSREEDFALFDESNPTATAHRSDIMAEIIDWLGTRYEFGGDGRAGVDCSAFTRAVFERAFGVELPRTAFEQHQLGEKVEKDGLRFGDLVFFHTAHYSPVSHVGIYIGEGLFANASCSRGVSVASIASPYWSKRFIGAKRLFNNSEIASSVVEQIHQMAAETSSSVLEDPAN